MDSNGTVNRVIFEARDITERKQYEDKLTQLALHDNLTGLPNRTFFDKRLREEMDHAVRSQKKLAVLFLDLDNFKMVNDRMGHNIGDQLLIGFADRLSNCLSEKDVIARLGGDEFVILLPELKDNDDAVAIANNILQVLQTEWEYGGHAFQTTSSIGISFSSL